MSIKINKIPKTKDANFAWKEKKVDNLIRLMSSEKDIIYFDDDDVFGESMFDAESILKKDLKILMKSFVFMFQLQMMIIYIFGKTIMFCY